MDIYSFNWSAKVVAKVIAKHNVLPEEAEQVFRNKRLIKKRENVMLAYGQSNSGRYLFVVFQPKSEGYIRIITARDMTKKERRLFRSFN